MTIRTTGNSRSYQFRPSDHLAGERDYRFGKLLPMDTPRRGWIARIRSRLTDGSRDE